MRKKLGLERARSQKHTVETIRPTMTELRKKWPLAGAREMKTILHREKGMSVTRHVYDYFLFCDQNTQLHQGYNHRVFPYL